MLHHSNFWEMLHLTRQNRRWFRSLIIAWMLGAFLLDPVSETVWTTQITSLVFCSLVIAWGYNVKHRILDRQCRRILTAIAYLFLLWFFSRMLRYALTTESGTAERLLWYAYYIFIIAISICCFLLASVVYIEDPHVLRHYRGLFFPAVILCGLILTNDFHQLAFRFIGSMKEEDYSYGPVYYAAAAWFTIFLSSSFVIIFRKYRRYRSRGYAWLPTVPLLFGLLLLLIYSMIGGSPEIAGIKLYQIHEVILLMVIGFCECCIQLGMIPSNSDYSAIFHRVSIPMEIDDYQNEPVFSSRSFLPLTKEQKHKAQTGSYIAGGSLQVTSRKIRGGTTYWETDLSDLIEVNRELDESQQKLSGEIRIRKAEHELAENNVRVATKRRLYDRISGIVRPQAEEVSALMNLPTSDEAEFKRNLTKAMVLCAYIKRRSNLEILKSGAGDIHMIELMLSIRESLEYVERRGVLVSVTMDEDCLMPADSVIFAYELFEEILEHCIPGLDAILVRLRAGEGVYLTMDAAPGTPIPDENWRKKDQLKQKIQLEKLEEESVYLRVRMEGGKKA